MCVLHLLLNGFQCFCNTCIPVITFTEQRLADLLVTCLSWKGRCYNVDACNRREKALAKGGVPRAMTPEEIAAIKAEDPEVLTLASSCCEDFLYVCILSVM